MKGLFHTLYDFEVIKDKLYIQAIGIERNKELLKSVPYMAVADMAITYRVLVSGGAESFSSFFITNKLMEIYGITQEQLHEAAMRSGPEIMAARLSTMEDILAESVNNSGGAGLKGSVRQDDLDLMIDTLLEDEALPEMYVLSSRQHIGGASVMFYPGVMKRVAERIGGAFYILPSSIHETIIVKVPDDGWLKVDDLYWMVREVNDNGRIIKADEILSYFVYQYNAEEDKIEIARKETTEPGNGQEVK